MIKYDFDDKLKLYISAANKQLQYVDTFKPVWCSDTMFCYYDNLYIGTLGCYSTFDLRKDPLLSDELTKEEVTALIDENYFSVEELKLYLDQLISRYCLTEKE